MPVQNTSVSLVSFAKKREMNICVGPCLYIYLSISLSLHLIFGNTRTAGKTSNPWFLEVVRGYNQRLPFLCLATRQLYSQKLDNVVSWQLYYESNVTEEAFCGSGSSCDLLHLHFGGFLFFLFQKLYAEIIASSRYFAALNFKSFMKLFYRSCKMGNFVCSVLWSNFSAESHVMVLFGQYPDVSKQHSILELLVGRFSNFS